MGLLSLQGEGPLLEYKLAIPSSPMLAHVIASFANSEGGEIIIGVDDDGTIRGLDSTELEKSPGAIRSALKLLRPHPELSHHIKEVEGKSLFVIEVQKSPTPVRTVNGRLYVRRGSRTVLTEEIAFQALANAVPTAKQNILSSLGVNAQETVRAQKSNQFEEIVHKRIEEETGLKASEALIETIKLTRQELFSERREKR